MAAWTPNRLHTALHKGEIASLYLLYGEEPFLIDESLVQIRALTMTEGLEDFNLDIFYGQNSDASAIRDTIETLPVMSERRLVILKEAQDLKEKDWQTLLPVLERPVESTTFVCIASKVDKRKKYVKLFTNQGVMVEFKRPYDNQIPNWIGYICQKNGLQASEDAIYCIQQTVGTNLSDINSEVMKIGQYLGGRTKIEAQDVLTVVSRTRVENVFELTNAIGSRDRARALMCLVNLLDHGQNEVGVLSLISRHFRILKAIKSGQKRGFQGQSLSQHAGVPVFFLKDYIQQARLWSEQKLDQSFEAILHTDRALKSSPLSSHIWLENFILQTCTA